jgi:hypothetical protein
MPTIKENLLKGDGSNRGGPGERETGGIKLVAVSKTVEPAASKKAIEAGVSVLGEIMFKRPKEDRRNWTIGGLAFYQASSIE